MADVTIRVDGLKELDQALQDAEQAFATRWVNGALRAGVIQIMRGMSPLVPRDTGNLLSSLRWSRGKPQSADSAVRNYAVVIGKHKLPTDPFYAHMVEFGTKPHVIKAASGGGFLHFGNTFARAVQHPGTRPDPFMEEGLSQGAQGALDAFRFYLGKKLDIATLPEALATGDE